jgi:hypothetical protein
MNIPEVTKARGQVVEDFVQIETLISSIITNFYVGRGNPFAFMFSLQVLYDENCSFGMKRNILRKILALTQTEKEQEKRITMSFRNCTTSTRSEICLPTVVLICFLQSKVREDE